MQNFNVHIQIFTECNDIKKKKNESPFKTLFLFIS